MADFTKDLNKMFVRVSDPLNETQRNSLITLSRENAKKIYFLEQTNEIMNRGITYGINPGDKQLITNLQHWVGSDTDKPADVSTIIDRLTALEAINVDVTGCADADKNSYLAYEDVNAGQAVQPKITLKITPIDGGALGTQKGLVDAQDAKSYIDDEVAKATTVVTEGKGIKVTSAEDNSDHHITYTVDSSLLLEYNAPSGGNSATITLTDGKGNSFGTVNVTDIIGNGLLDHTDYNENTNVLTLTFNTATGEARTVDVDLKKLIDINDVFIGTDSTNYLKVINDTSTATFNTIMEDVSTASATATGLADAWQVKQYVDSKTLDVAVSANGDSYVSADASANNNKHIVVSTNIANLVANAGKRGTWSVSETDGTATRTGETDPTLTGTTGKLIDSEATATQVKTYVDAKVAQEASERQARIQAAIKSLDADINSTGDSNIGLNIKEVDGKLTTAAFTVTYAGVTQSGTGSDSTFVVTSGDEAKLVKAKDLTSLQTHVEQKLKGALDSLDATVNAKDASTYIDFTVNEADGKLTDASIAVTYGTLSGADDTHGHHTGTEGIATTQVVADFVDGYDYWTTYTPV